MVFSSLVFLFGFLPCVLGLYFSIPFRRRNTVLFIVSLLFYAWGEPTTAWVMLFSILSAYLFGFFIEKYRKTMPKKAKRFFLASILISLSTLFFFKYYNFLARNLSRLPFLYIPIISDLRLPIGISFYTFQIISYTVDLYRGNCRLQKSFISFGTYVTLFPQLIAGPIVRYTDVDRQLTERRESFEQFASGVFRFCCGLGKKVIIGDSLALACRYFESLSSFSPTAVGAWMTVISFTLHLYYDFSGYSDMAIGLGRMLGFSFPENFSYPYISKSITEFWRRWHISLSTWFREYVYIPLGGNRRGRLVQYRNLLVVWVLTGFWHGADWNFILWGLYFAIILILEKAFLKRWIDRAPAILAHFYTMLLVVLGFLLFHFSNLSQATFFLGALLGIGCEGFTGAVVNYQLLRLLPLGIIAILGATPCPRMLFCRILRNKPFLGWLPGALSVFLLLVCIAYLVDSTFSPFAYLQF